MLQPALAQRGLLGDRAPWHVGDIAWGLRQHEGRETGWSIRLWVEEGRVVAWSWLKPDGWLDADVHGDYPQLLDEVLAEQRARVVFAFEDDVDLRATLARHGFEQQESPLYLFARPLDDLPPPPTLPDGFRYHTVEEADVAERVGIYRDVWAPSRATCVVEAPDGRFAAYGLLWPDEHGVGELEPVGVRETFRRRGFGTAICTYALPRWREEGGTRAVVYCKSDEANALYHSIGFDCHATLHGYAR